MEQQARLPWGVNKARVTRLILSLNEVKLKLLVGKNTKEAA